MPNWVKNTVVAYGDPAIIKKLVIFLASDESVFDFNKVRPINDENWTHECAMENWGTTLNAYEAEKSLHSGNYVEYHFETAWTAPEAIYRTLLLKFDSIEITCFARCPDSGFAGCLTTREYAKLKPNVDQPTEPFGNSTEEHACDSEQDMDEMQSQGDQLTVVQKKQDASIEQYYLEKELEVVKAMDEVLEEYNAEKTLSAGKE